VLVNNAGVAIHRDSGDFDEARWRRIMSLNLDAVWQLRQNLFWGEQRSSRPQRRLMRLAKE